MLHPIFTFNYNSIGLERAKYATVFLNEDSRDQL